MRLSATQKLRRSRTRVWLLTRNSAQTDNGRTLDTPLDSERVNERTDDNGQCEQGHPGRQPRTRCGAPLHAGRRAGRHAQPRDDRSVERQGRPAAGEDRMAPRSCSGARRPRASTSTSPRANRSTSRAGCRRGSGTTRMATSATRPRSAATGSCCLAAAAAAAAAPGARVAAAGGAHEHPMGEPVTELTDDDIPF